MRLQILLFFLFYYTLYSKETLFPCKSGEEIPLKFLNDDYCDCLSGEDEPLTSACSPLGKYTCNNFNSKPVVIPSYKVHDGICEPECCDGSDEKSGICPNVCIEKARLDRIAREKDKIIQEAGAKQKWRFIQQAQSARFSRREEIATLEKDLKILQENYEKQKNLVQEKEKLEQQEMNTFCAPYVDHAIVWLEEMLKGLKELKKTDVQSFENFTIQFLDFTSSTFSSSAPTSITTTTKSDTDQEDLEDLLATNSSDIEVEKSKKWTLCQPYFSKLVDFTNQLKSSMDSLESKAITPDSPIILDAIQARRKLEKLESLLTTKVNRNAELNTKQDTDYGKDGVYESLDGSCFSAKVSEYEYEMCFFGSASQKASGSHVNLGTWSNWTGPSHDLYSEALFTDGLACWNGPARSLRVKFRCGAEEKILSVQEPSKCEYVMEMETATMCDETIIPAPPVSSATSSKETQQEGHVEL